MAVKVHIQYDHIRGDSVVIDNGHVLFRVRPNEIRVLSEMLNDIAEESGL